MTKCFKTFLVPSVDVEETKGMCLHQQKNVVIFFLWISGSIKLIAFWQCVSRILMHHPAFIGNSHEREKEEEIPPSLPRPMPSLLTRCGFGNEAKVVPAKPCRKPRQEISNVLFRNLKLHEVKDEHCNWKRQTTHLWIRGSRIPTSRMSRFLAIRTPEIK